MSKMQSLGSEKSRKERSRVTLATVSATLGFVFLALGITLFAATNLSNRYFWTDESSTFLTSLSWPQSGFPAGDLSTMWAGTMKAFLDPGLFHLTSRFIAMNVGSSIEVLRAFPFLFFLSYLVAIVLLIRFLSAPWFLAVLGPAIMLLENITLYYAVEFRPYSASLAAAVVVPLITLYVIKRPKLTWVVAASLIFSLLALQQYTIGSVAVAAAAMLIASLLGRPDRRTKVLILLLATYFALFLPSFYAATRGDQIGASTDSIRYTGPTVLRGQGMEEILEILQTNFLSLTSLPRTLFLLSIPVLLVSRRISFVNEGVRSREFWIVLLWVYVLVGTLASAAASALGVLPWVMGTRWSITEIGYIAVSVAGLMGLFVQWKGFQSRRVYVAAAALSMVMTLVAGIRLASYERGNNYDYLTYLAPSLLTGHQGKSVIDYWIYPDVRYWLEYSGEYPEFREDWVELDARMSPDFVRANSETITAFLQSDDDRLLLAGSWALIDYGRPLPDNVKIVQLPDSALTDEDPRDVPVLLVKN